MLDNGELLTEGPGDRAGHRRQGVWQEARPGARQHRTLRLQEWLNYITTEVHKNFGQLFNPAIPDDVKNSSRSA